MKSGSPSQSTAAHKTQTKLQAWSSLVFHCRHSSFNPSEAPPWDSRPVIRPFLTQHAAQLLVQALVISRLDYCNALLAELPSNTIKPLQMIQNAVARLVFSEPKRAHVTPLFISLLWLQLASSSRHWCLHIEQPQAQHPPTSTHL